MNTIDVLVIALVIISGVLGLYWGIIRQILAIVGLVAGIALASRYGQNVADWMTSFIPDGRTADVLGFVAVLVGVSALASFLASILHRFAGLLFLGWADHLIGGVLGLLQGAVMSAVLIAVLAANPNEQVNAAMRDSRYAMYVVQTFGFVFALMPESVRTSAEIFFGGL